ncbi:SDR family NAD(P)-dependent oxidoreductase [Hyphococcus luteus]|uniref:3-oxoacyl-ACP reductase n=1 Tax=Hyphococcus luteus TaxID=2058213 RepID=A0A2S7K592_9PROT|nr:SDR family oxidoreductase [Marinicaulis flavus]PQA87662.1 3-oxoacyl-ACP reductase [Marinicaulis flavus]
MDLQLEGKTALITGGGTGIGYGIAEALIQEGARVVILGRREQVLREAAGRLAEFAEFEPEIMVHDLTAPDAGKAIAAEALDRFGHIDILVNNAGTSEVLGVGGAEDRWQHAYALRVIAPRQLAEALLPEMRARKFGRIINIGGTFEVQSIINSASVMNAARTVYSKSLSHEVARDGITVNTVGPGVIISEQIDKIFPTKEAREEYCNRNIPVGYFGEPQDLAVMVTFLASPIARYITGEVIAVDGGSHRFAF